MSQALLEKKTETRKLRQDAVQEGTLWRLLMNRKVQGKPGRIIRIVRILDKFVDAEVVTAGPSGVVPFAVINAMQIATVVQNYEQVYITSEGHVVGLNEVVDSNEDSSGDLSVNLLEEIEVLKSRIEEGSAALRVEKASVKFLSKEVQDLTAANSLGVLRLEALEKEVLDGQQKLSTAETVNISQEHQLKEIEAANEVLQRDNAITQSFFEELKEELKDYAAKASEFEDKYGSLEQINQQHIKWRKGQEEERKEIEEKLAQKDATIESLEQFRLRAEADLKVQRGIVEIQGKAIKTQNKNVQQSQDLAESLRKNLNAANDEIYRLKMDASRPAYQKAWDFIKNVGRDKETL